MDRKRILQRLKFKEWIVDTDILSNDLFVRDPEIMTAYGLLKQHYYTTLSPMSFKMAFAVADIYRESYQGKRQCFTRIHWSLPSYTVKVQDMQCPGPMAPFATAADGAATCYGAPTPWRQVKLDVIEGQELATHEKWRARWTWTFKDCLRFLSCCWLGKPSRKPKELF